VPRVFITGTGTDVGKTYVAVQLIRHLRRQRQTVHAFKPVVTGYTPDTMAASDCAALLAALDEPITDEAVNAISPWRYRAALGPGTAAMLEGRNVHFSAIAAFTLEVLQASVADFTIVEGLGGVMVPFDDEHTLLDLLAVAAVPAVVVAGTYLGSLSHTLTALDALAARGISIASLVVNESSGSAVTLEQTACALKPFVRKLGSTLVKLRREPAPSDIATMCEAVIGAAAQCRHQLTPMLRKNVCHGADEMPRSP
jgi:dethiobiotin synthetase